jgi:hypothetical protein
MWWPLGDRSPQHDPLFLDHSPRSATFATYSSKLPLRVPINCARARRMEPAFVVPAQFMGRD